MIKKTFALLLVAVVLASACISGGAVFKKKYGDYDINFRADLNLADKVPVYSYREGEVAQSENGISDLTSYIFDKKNYLFYISFLPSEKENGFYAVSGFELANKMVTAFKRHYKIDKPYIQNTNDGFMCMIFGETIEYDKVLCIKTVPLNTTDDIENMVNSTAGKSVIFLKGPEAGATETSVIVDSRGIITLQGKDFSEDKRTFTDLDLAVDKFVTALLDTPPEGN